MRDFPPTQELQFLVGLEIGQICLDPWSTQFRFTDGGQISIEGPFEHLDEQAQLHSHQGTEQQDRDAVFFRDLIQRRVVQIEREPSRLTLIFENGAKLAILSERISYESGQIYPPGREHDPIVF